MVDAACPLAPPVQRVGEQSVDISGVGSLEMRRKPGQGQIQATARFDGERSAMDMVVGVHLDAAHQHGIRARDRQQCRRNMAAHLADPGQRTGIVEAHPQFRREINVPGDALDATHELHPTAVDRHELSHLSHTGGCLPAGDEHERVVFVVPGHRGVGVGSADGPVAVLLFAQQRSEDRRRVVSRQAQPVDASLSGDKRSRAAVAQNRVVLDRGSHDPILSVRDALPAV